MTKVAVIVSLLLFAAMAALMVPTAITGHVTAVAVDVHSPPMLAAVDVAVPSAQAEVTQSMLKIREQSAIPYMYREPAKSLVLRMFANLNTEVAGIRWRTRRSITRTS